MGALTDNPYANDWNYQQRTIQPVQQSTNQQNGFGVIDPSLGSNNTGVLAPQPTNGTQTPSATGAPTQSGDSMGWSPRAGSLWDVLWQRQGQNIIPSAKDPIIAGQVNAYNALQTRNTRNAINEEAESMGPTANLNTERRMMNENASQNAGMLQSQLLQNELAARRGEVQNSLGLLSGLLSNQDSLGLQQALGMGQLGLQAEDRANYWDALRSGLLG